MSDHRLFALGQVVATPGALRALGEAAASPFTLISRHVRGDWSEMDAHDQQANADAVREDTRILSAYTVAGEKVWVITEADRSSTCVLLPEEY